MGKLFAVTLAVVALASAYPIVTHMFAPPVDISTHGHLIDEQLHDTMLEAGISFLAAQLLLAFCVWKFSARAPGRALKTFPGGAPVLVVAAFVLVGLEILGLGIKGQKAWASVYFTPAANDALQVQAQAGQFAFYFRYSGPDGKFGKSRPEKINEAEQNYFGLDPANDAAARDDIVTGELGVPVGREVLLTMHSKDVSHSFFVRELRIQQDFLPGLDLAIHFTATRTGRFEIVCTQLCGLGHYNMKAYLNVMSAQDFDSWLGQKASEQ
jgi:cytochrome c oxidase subunit 2